MTHQPKELDLRKLGALILHFYVRGGSFMSPMKDPGNQGGLERLKLNFFYTRHVG